MKSGLDYIGKSGLIDRRSILASGVALLTAAILPTKSEGMAKLSEDPIGESFPDWMKSEGVTDEEYGQPSPFEADVKRNVGTFYGEAHPSPVNSKTPIQNQRGIITPSGLHFGVHHSGIPKIDPTKHELKIHGMVEKPLKFSVESLLRYPMKVSINFLECGGNSGVQAVIPDPTHLTCQEIHGLLSGSEWAGVSLKRLMEETGLSSKAKWVIAEGADASSHARSIPIEKIMDDAIIALYQNGERLRPAQGYPMRLFLSGWEGNTNVKWLHRLEITDQPAYTKDESGSYTETMPDKRIRRFSLFMDVKSLITHPSAGQHLPDTGFYEISGLAWSGYGKINRVEVSADSGRTWVPATLHGPILPKSLTRFSIPWRWRGQQTCIMSRATDETGNVQPTRAVWKSRYASFSYTHYNAIQVWEVMPSGEVRNVFL